jgi:hypothetical protein
LEPFDFFFEAFLERFLAPPDTEPPFMEPFLEPFDFFFEAFLERFLAPPDMEPPFFEPFLEPDFLERFLAPPVYAGAGAGGSDMGTSSSLFTFGTRFFLPPPTMLTETFGDDIYIYNNLYIIF